MPLSGGIRTYSKIFQDRCIDPKSAVPRISVSPPHVYAVGWRSGVKGPAACIMNGPSTASISITIAWSVIRKQQSTDTDSLMRPTKL